MPVNGTFCVSVMKDRCINARMPGKCATCVEVCPYNVYTIDDTGHVHVQNYNACVGCRICAEFCPEDAIRINPAESEMVSRAPWTFPVVEEIHEKSLTGEYGLRGFGTMGYMPNFDNITIVPSQIASAPPRDKYREECDMEVVIGEDTCENPIRLHYPFLFPAMSFGALSREARMALAIGAAQTGIMSNTGEGGLVKDETWLIKGYEDEARKRKRWEPGGFLAVQWSTGRWGVSADYVRSGDAVEIKIGQGAKPGMGGHLLGAKVTAEVAAVRGIPVGSDALSPCRYYDVLEPKDMKHMVSFLRDVTDYKVPILFKLGPSRPYADIKACVEAGADAISIDGLVGGTGASPAVVTQGVGIPTVALIPPAVQALKDLGVHRKVKLFVLGGMRSGLDAYKAMAMGADGVGFGAAAEIAMGCRACMACHAGRCPYGITSQDPALRARLDPVEAGHRLANFIKATAEEVKILTMLSGHSSIRDLSEEDLRAMEPNVASITGLKLVGYERRMPIWESG
ncbi:MAG TPA: FMN-binding glutamate synthase family protein, partial [Halothiobacillaceae bacterium]|nr:FMN-binding glutamate synthase family protein [Halothiobacillaceae bacterium]